MLDIRATTPDDLPELVALETASYPGDEAATPEGLRARYAQAAPYFLTARLEGYHAATDLLQRRQLIGVLINFLCRRIVGFICATRIDLAYLSEESMSTHTPTGPSLCIHSVVVEQSHRRRGYATELLRAVRPSD